MLDPLSQSVTIAVEWEQTRRQEHARSSTMLRRLAEEVRLWQGLNFGARPQLIVCVSEADLEECRSFVLARLGDDLERFELCFLPARGEYYQVKNAAAAAATSELVVFLDSDVVPEHEWLSRLLEPFTDPEVLFVCGNTYVELTSTYSRAFALNWFFPLRSRSDEPRPLSRLVPNNLAARRDAAARYPFPSIPETSLGSCQMLQRSLSRRGVKMVQADGARVGHPAPTGFEQFFLRAFSRGRDRLMYQGPGRDRSLRGTWQRLRADLSASVRRTCVRRAEVGISPAALPVAVAVTISFMLCCALGEVLTMVNRTFMTSHFRV
jgi:hypothetical protein